MSLRGTLSSLPNSALEKVLLKVLTNHLSTFIANLTKEHLRLGLWAGKAKKRREEM